MDLTPLGQFVGSIGLPGAIALYVLIRIEPALTSLRDAIIEMRGVIQKCGGPEK